MPETHRRTNLPKLSHNLQKHLKSHEHFPAPKRTPDNINVVSKAESPKIHYYLKQHEAKDWSWTELEMEAETHWLKQERPTENAGNPRVRQYKCWYPLAQWREKAEAVAQLHFWSARENWETEWQLTPRGQEWKHHQAGEEMRKGMSGQLWSAYCCTNNEGRAQEPVPLSLCISLWLCSKVPLAI